MPTINVHYGPYKANGILKHRPQRLHGITECLSKLGYTVDLVPSPHLDRVTVEMHNSEIFRCGILSLLFNIPCEDDPTCKRLVSAVKEAEQFIYSENNVPHHESIRRASREIKNAALSTGVQLWVKVPP